MSDRPAQFTGHTGAGFYGGRTQSHKTACAQSNNPFGHSRECACGWWAEERASRTVPYMPEKAELHTFFGGDE